MALAPAAGNRAGAGWAGPILATPTPRRPVPRCAQLTSAQRAQHVDTHSSFYNSPSQCSLFLTRSWPLAPPARHQRRGTVPRHPQQPPSLPSRDAVAVHHFGYSIQHVTAITEHYAVVALQPGAQLFGLKRL